MDGYDLGAMQSGWWKEAVDINYHDVYRELQGVLWSDSQLVHDLKCDSATVRRSCD